MRIRVQVIIESDHETMPSHVEEVVCPSLKTLTPETLGLQLCEAKQILAGVQRVITTRQVEDYVEEQRHCSHCQKSFSYKGHHHIGLRTLFGKLTLSSQAVYLSASTETKLESRCHLIPRAKYTRTLVS